MWRPRSLRGRLTLWYTLVLSLMLLAFGAGTLAVVKRVLVSRSDLFLTEALETFAAELNSESIGVGSSDEAFATASRDVHFRDIDFVFRPEAGGRWSSVPREGGYPHEGMISIPVDVAELDRIVGRPSVQRAGAPRIASLSGDPESRRIVWRTYDIATGSFTIAGLQSRAFLEETLRAAIIAFLIAVPLAVLTACCAGYVLARSALSPITEMSRRARAITAERLSDRLPMNDARGEIGELTAMFNDLLARLEASFAQQRRFVADASHELRTPVAIIRAESEIALARDRSVTEYREALRVVDDASRRLSGIVEDLFLLARVDAGRQPLRWEQLYLNEVTAEAVRSMRGPATLRDVRIEMNTLPDAPVWGDPELLGRLLLNLIDNAIKHSPARSSVTVRMERRDTGWDVLVIDTGGGIPAEARAHVFDRFFRVDVARSRSERSSTSGAGLGLSIARWIAEAHGGSLELVRSGSGGSTFRFTMPSAPPSSRLAATSGAADPVIATPGG